MQPSFECLRISDTGLNMIKMNIWSWLIVNLVCKWHRSFHRVFVGTKFSTKICGLDGPSVNSQTHRGARILHQTSGRLLGLLPPSAVAVGVWRWPSFTGADKNDIKSIPLPIDTIDWKHLGISKSIYSVANSFGTHRSYKLDHWFYSDICLHGSMVQHAKLLDSIGPKLVTQISL